MTSAVLFPVHLTLSPRGVHAAEEGGADTHARPPVAAARGWPRRLPRGTCGAGEGERWPGREGGILGHPAAEALACLHELPRPLRDPPPWRHGHWAPGSQGGRVSTTSGRCPAEQSESPDTETQITVFKIPGSGSYCFQDPTRDLIRAVSASIPTRPAHPLQRTLVPDHRRGHFPGSSPWLPEPFLLTCFSYWSPDAPPPRTCVFSLRALLSAFARAPAGLGIRLSAPSFLQPIPRGSAATFPAPSLLTDDPKLRVLSPQSAETFWSWPRTSLELQASDWGGYRLTSRGARPFYEVPSAAQPSASDTSQGRRQAFPDK